MFTLKPVTFLRKESSSLLPSELAISILELSGGRGVRGEPTFGIWTPFYLVSIS